MGNRDQLIQKIEAWAEEPLLHIQLVGGGCVACTEVISTVSGRTFFLKTGCSALVLQAEANGLTELKKAGAIRVPELLFVNDDALILEYIPEGAQDRTFFERFGQQLAQLHQFRSDGFGFFENNYLGSNLQMNLPEGTELSDWDVFYFQKRLLPQFRLAEKNGFADEKFRRHFFTLEKRVTTILSGGEEPPGLLHGDLWSGNFLAASNGDPVLIDPAVYYGHREADLAMTKLFGGFPTSFYAAYQNCYPLPAGAEFRENIYFLYHVLNHLNLFGFGYYRQAIQLMASYA